MDIRNKRGHLKQALDRPSMRQSLHTSVIVSVHVMVKSSTPRSGNEHQFDSKPHSNPTQTPPFPVHVAVGHTIDRRITVIAL